jgi:hypothetical protein
LLVPPSVRLEGIRENFVTRGSIQVDVNVVDPVTAIAAAIVRSHAPAQLDGRAVGGWGQFHQHILVLYKVAAPRTPGGQCGCTRGTNDKVVTTAQENASSFHDVFEIGVADLDLEDGSIRGVVAAIAFERDQLPKTKFAIFDHRERGRVEGAVTSCGDVGDECGQRSGVRRFAAGNPSVCGSRMRAGPAGGENARGQFWADFQAAMPTLTPDELQQWIAAGIALANYTNAVTTSAQKYADFQIASYGDAFISSMSGIIEAEQAQIETANELAQAAGLAGASQKDIANIMRMGSAQMGKAIADLTQGITGDISSLNNLIASTGDSTLNRIAEIQASIGAGGNYQQQQQHAQQVSTAYDLVQKLGDFSFGTGEDVDQVLKDFGLSPGAIGKILGENADQVRDQIKAAADQAAEMTNLVAVSEETNDILRDLLDVAQGKDPTVDLTKYTTAPSGDGGGGSTKPRAATGTLPSGGYPAAMTSAMNSTTAALRSNTAATTAHAQELRNVRRYLPTPHNTRGLVPH